MGFYEDFKEFKNTNNFSFSELAKEINKTGDALRMGINRETLSFLEKEKFNELINSREDGGFDVQGYTLKKARRTLGLSQRELAEKIGVSKNTIYNYEQGKKIPKSKIQILQEILLSDNKEPANSEVFRIIRMNLGITQAELGDKLGLNARTIINYESENSPIPKSIMELMDKYQKTVINKNGNEFVLKDDGSYNIEVDIMPFLAYSSYLETFENATVHHDFDRATFNVDKFGRGNYKAFRTKGDSMNGGGIYDTPDGALVLGRELLKHHWTDGFNDNDYGWIILATENIFHKDIIVLDEKGEITCHSRNTSPEYSDFTINLNNVYQIFKVIKRTF